MLLSFAVLMGAFIVYREFVQLPQSPRGSRGAGAYNGPVIPDLPHPTTGPVTLPPGGRDIGSGKDLNYTHRNTETGALEYIFSAERYDRLPDGSLALVKPRIQFFKRQGRIDLTGDKGHVFYEQIQGKIKPNVGHFSGNVRLVIDRKPGGTFSTVKDRPDDVVEVLMEDVDFDNSELKISTAGRVEVRSSEMDIIGSELTMNLEQAPDELRLLRIGRGEELTIKVMSLEGFGEMVSSAETDAGGTGAKPVTTGTPRPWAVQDLSTLTSPPPVNDPDAAEIDAILLNGPAPDAEPATRPIKITSRPGKPDKPMLAQQNVYYAEFLDSANAMSVEMITQTPEGEWKTVGRLENIARLAMIFDWDNDKRNRDTASAEAAAITTAASQPVKPTQPVTHTVVRWSGPLEIRPFDYTDSPSSRHHNLYARGERMKMINADSVAELCELFYYRAPAHGDTPAMDRGRFLGSDNAKVLLTSADETVIESPVVRFDRPSGRLDLIGASQIAMLPQRDAGVSPARLAGILPASGEDALTSSTDQANSTHNAGETPAPQPASPDVITSDTWIAAFLQPALGGDGKQLRDNKGKPRWFIPQALCLGNTTINRPSTGEQITCDRRAYVEMSPPSDGPSRPKLLHGQGNVDAQFVMEDNSRWRVRGEETTVRFDLLPDPRTGQLRNQPAVMQADHNVQITVTPSDGGEPLVMTGDRANGLWSEKRYELIGSAQSPATVRQSVRGPEGQEGGFNGVNGPQIVLDDKDGRQLMQVIGPGRLDMLSDRGPDGEKLDQPVPMVVTWARGMNFFGKDSRAEFRDNVAMDRGRGQDLVTGQRMDVWFERAETRAETRAEGVSPSRPAGILPARNDETDLASSSAPANGTHNAGETPAPRGAVPGMDVRSFKDLRVATVKVEEKVYVLSRRFDDDGHLTGRLRLWCNDLAYDAAGRVMTVAGPGKAFTEDYNKPRDPAADGATTKPAATRPATQTGVAAAADGMMQSPSRTAFEWDKRMQLAKRDDGTATMQMDGRAIMVHHSGDQLVLTESEKKELNVPDWGKLSPGRHTVLECDKMEADFDAPRVASGTAARGEGVSPSRPAGILPARNGETDVTSSSAPASGTHNAGGTPAARGPAGEAAQLGMSVGKLKNFRALGGVTLQDALRDGQYRLSSQRLIFDGATQLLTLYGYMEGEPRKRAEIVHYDLLKGRGPVTHEGEIIRWNMRTQEIKTEQGRTTGGR